MVDVLLLAECVEEPANALAELNRELAEPFLYPESETQKVRLFCRRTISQVIDQHPDNLGGLAIRRILLPERPETILATVHLPSKIDFDRDDQTLYASLIAQDIIRVEDTFFNRRTILVGDLNMNPFDPGVTGSHALHGLMSRRLVKVVGRTIRGRQFRAFYNPMWGFLGDRTEGPAGTYFLNAAKPVNYFWNIYDQVLVRAELMDNLLEVRILDSDGIESLVKPSGRPRASDHLPLNFRIDLVV